MRSMLDEFLNDIETYASARGIKPDTVTAYAVGNSKLYSNIKSGGQCLPSTVERTLQYIAENPVKEGAPT